MSAAAKTSIASASRALRCVLLPEGWTQEQADKLISTTPLGRLGSPEDVAQAVLYLLNADYVTGETIIVDGGRHVRT